MEGLLTVSLQNDAYGSLQGMSLAPPRGAVADCLLYRLSKLRKILNSKTHWTPGASDKGCDLCCPCTEVSEHNLPGHSLGNLPQVTPGGRECAAETGPTM